MPGKSVMANLRDIVKLLALPAFVASLYVVGVLYAGVAKAAATKYSFLYMGQAQTENRNRKSPERIISLFTTLRDVKVRETLHKDTLMNWASLAPSVLPVLFVMPNDSKYWTRRARELGWMVENVTRADAGVPILKDMFNVTATKYPSPFIGFANADNLFGKSLVDTLAGLSLTHPDLVHNRISLIVGRRRMIKDTEIKDTSGEYVDSIALRLRLYPSYAQDYFILGNGGKFHWNRVPDFIVGRLGYDNWLVVMAQRWNVTLIDGTKTIHNLHQDTTAAEGTPLRLYQARSRHVNYEAAGRQFNYIGGVTDCSFWSSVNCFRPSNNGNGTYSVCLEKNTRRGGCPLPDL